MIRLWPQPAAAHGGAVGVHIDLSASLNPLGPSPVALAAARAAELTHYPDVDARSLIQAAAARHGLTETSIVPCPGASWGIWLCGVALLSRGDSVVALGPCFGEYRRAVSINGGTYQEVWTEAELLTVLEFNPALCMLANPANPSANVWSGDKVRDLCQSHPRTCFAIDEAFAPFAPEGTSVLDHGPPPANSIVIRSLTKELSLPGLRMGYLVAEPDVAQELRGILPAWPVGASDLAAAAAGMADREHVTNGAALARMHVWRLSLALSAAGHDPLPSVVNYLLVHAPGLHAMLAAHGIAVRDCASFGLPNHVRIAAPRPDDLPVVLAAIQASS